MDHSSRNTHFDHLSHFGHFVNDPSFVPSSSPVMDVDQRLAGVFSMLNISPEYYNNNISGGGHVGSSSGGGHEGVFQSCNGYNNNGHVLLNDMMVDGLLNRGKYYYSGEVEALRPGFGSDFDSGFDSGFEFDQKSRLYYSDPCFDYLNMGVLKLNHGHHGHDVGDTDKRMKFKSLDGYEEKNGYCGNSFGGQIYGHGHGQSQGQGQEFEVMGPWSLKELRGRVYAMAKDQHGCRILQAMMEWSKAEEVEIVVCEVVDFICDLMKDQFGNYFVQKLVPMCNDEQKMRLILSLTEVPTDIILVCMNPHGTRAVQKLLENLNPKQVKLVINALYRGAATLAVDPNGHHVIQYCLINFPTDINKHILIEIANQCYKIATDRSGCCVLQACVEHSRGELRTRIIAEIMTKSVHLAEDPFGNYVLQHMIGLNVKELTELLVRQLQGNFAYLACNKYASNVVEKCLNECGEEMSTKIVMELVRSPNASSLLVDPYANFVIQSALKVSKGFAHECLCKLISKNMLSMRTNLYGKKVLEKFEKKRVSFA